jgi:hypothetical protein
MQHPIDPNKLTTILVEGERTYSDGRHAFWYENLCRVMKEVGIEIDGDALHKESERRWEARNNRPKCKKVAKRKVYLFEVMDDSDKYFDLHFSQYGNDLEDELPGHYKQSTTVLCDQSPMAIYKYETYSRKAAAKLLRYIKKAHPTREWIKTTIS